MPCMKLRSDRYVVPIVFVAALLAALSVTVQWIPRSIPPLRLRVTMGPSDINRLNKSYGLRFTPHNAISNRTVMSMIPSERRCIDVAITNSALTYLDQEPACRLPDGSYKLSYIFKNPHHYVIFAALRPADGVTAVGRFPVLLSDCERRRKSGCHAPLPLLRGLETIHTRVIDGLTIVFTSSSTTVETGRPVQLTFSFLRNGRAVQTVEPHAPYSAVAVALDTFHLEWLKPLDGQLVKGRLASGSMTVSGVFDLPSIYRVFVDVRYKGRPLKTSFVVDVDPAPKPTPNPSD